MSPSQCRGARALLGMLLHELAAVSDVNQRMIASYEDPASREAVDQDALAAITAALQRLGIVFSGCLGVGWSSPFAASQNLVIRALSPHDGASPKHVADILMETGCSRSDLVVLETCQVIARIDYELTLTKIGLYVASMLITQEVNGLVLRVKYSPVNYEISFVHNRVTHRPTSAVFNLEDYRAPTLRDAANVPHNELEAAKAGAEEALRLYHEGDPSVTIRKYWA